MYVHFQEFLLAMELHYYDVQTLTKNFTYHAIAVPIVRYTEGTIMQLQY